MQHLHIQNQKPTGIYYIKENEDQSTFVESKKIEQKAKIFKENSKWEYFNVEKVYINKDSEIQYLPYFSSAKQVYANLLDSYSYSQDNSTHFYLLLEGISQFTNLQHLQLSLCFLNVKSNEDYQFFKCLQNSFPQLQSLDLELSNVSQMVNNLFCRLNQNIKKLKLNIDLAKFGQHTFQLEQFKNFKQVEYFSLTVSQFPSKFQHLASIFQTTKVFKLHVTSVSGCFSEERYQDLFNMCPFIQNSETLESLSLQMDKNDSQQTILKHILDRIKKCPINLKSLMIVEKKVQEIQYPQTSYIYDSEIFLRTLQSILPQLIVFKFNAKAFQFKVKQPQHYPSFVEQQEVEEIEFLKNLSKALLKSTILQELDLRFGGQLIASEETIREFFSSIAMKGLKTLILDLERWNGARRILTHNQDIHLVSFLLKSLKERCIESLTTLKINFDGWDIFDDYRFLVQEIVDFTNISDLIVMGPKNRILLKNYPLLTLEQMANNKKRYIPILKALQKYAYKAHIRVDYLSEIATQFIAQYEMQHVFNQPNDPFTENIQFYQIQSSVLRDPIFYGYKINQKLKII